jgi:anti-sigma factor RsiW
MTDCLNDTMRDRLPELAHGGLSPADAAALRAHIAGCSACAADLAVLETSRLVLSAHAPKVDVAAITRAVTGAPVLRVERRDVSSPASRANATGRTPAWRSRQFLAAAASLLIVASLTIPALGRGGPEEVVPVGRDTVLAVVADTPAVPAGPSSLAVSEGLVDLSSDDLSTLLAELERVEATVNAEPSTLRQPIVDTPEAY